MDIFGAIYEFIKDIWNYLRGKNESKHAKSSYLQLQERRHAEIGRDWVGSGNTESKSFLLSTLDAFVPLYLARERGQKESISDALNQHDRLVIQGQPGAGKSTLASFLTLMMTKTMQEPSMYKPLLEKRLGYRPLLPIRCKLNEGNGQASVKELILASAGTIAKEQMNVWLAKESVLIVFDGLDEVANPLRRHQLKGEIADLSEELLAINKESRFVITTRTAGYDHRVLGGAGFALRTLKELDPLQQEEIIHNYYSLWDARMDREAAKAEITWEEKAKDLIAEIRHHANLRQLTVTPLLLALVSFQHFLGKSVPKNAFELYDFCIRELVTRRDQQSLSDQEIDRRFHLLGELAITMLDNPSKSYTMVEMEQLLQNALALYPGSESSSQLLERMEKEWGMVHYYEQVGIGTLYYTFANKSFQEFLAARIINHAPQRHWETLRRNLGNEDWREVMVLYTAMPAQSGQLFPIDQVIQQLKEMRSQSPDLWIMIGRCVTHERNHRNRRSRFHNETIEQLIRLSYGHENMHVEALGILCQIEPEGRRLLVQRLIREKESSWEKGLTLQTSLVSQLQSEALSPDSRHYIREVLLSEVKSRRRVQERIALGEALGQLGDPPHIFIEVVDISNRPPKSFKISKYPVTNAAYARFADITHPRLPKHWGDAKFPPRLANHPVTNVSLRDAEAYCAWLSEQTGISHRLPTDDEWLFAALGHDPDQKYPWGNTFDTERLNSHNSYNGTTPVGIFPDGESVFQIADLMGNVWEWTSTTDRGNYKLRGGDFGMVNYQSLRKLLLLQTADFSAPTIGFRIVRLQPATHNKQQSHS